MKRALPWLVVAAVLLFVGDVIGDMLEDAPAAVVRTVVREVTPPEYAETVEALRLDREGLLARIRGLEARRPDTVLVVDTVYLPAIAHGTARIDRSGRLTVEVLRLQPAADSVDAAYRPELHQGIDVADCDDGFTLQDGEVVCDRARLGHLYALGGVGVRASFAGLAWEPSYRSLWEIRAGRSFAYDRSGDAWAVSLNRRIQLW